MSALLDVILPVFLVIGFGYWAVWRGYFSDQGADALMKFTQSFAIPCLLFRAISHLELGPAFTPQILASYYGAALICFGVTTFGARIIFGRDWQDSVAIGFGAMFANSVLLGLPITQRAYGTEALDSNYAIIALNAPFCYTVGITAMEIARNGTAARRALPGKVMQAVFRNALILAICLGFFINLTALPLPQVLWDGIDLMVRAALPAALFGLGGVLVRYKPSGDMRTIVFVVAVSLLLHPALVWGFGSMVGQSTEAFRSAVLTSAMAPGVNAYVFSNIYGRGQRVAASAVLLATGLSVFTVWGWLAILP